MRRCAGQSTVEFAVGTAVLVLLMLGVVTLSGYQEVQRRMAFMARQAAFQTAWIGGRQTFDVAQRALTRQYLDDAALRDATGQRQLVAADEGRVTGAELGPPGLGQSLVASLITPLRASSGFLGAQFDLTLRGYHQGNVAVRIAPIDHLPQPFSDLDLRLQQPYALLADAWHSGRSEQVRERTSGLVPTAPLSAWSKLWRPLQAALSIVEPSLAQLCLGLIEAERIPEDRLGPGNTPLPGKCK